MTTAPILVLPNLDAPYVIETDASDYAVGVVLLQQGDDGQMHLLAFESKKLSAACCNNQKNNENSKETRISQRDPKNRIELKFISNKNNLSIYNKFLLMAGYINMCMEAYMVSDS